MLPVLVATGTLWSHDTAVATYPCGTALIGCVWGVFVFRHLQCLRNLRQKPVQQVQSARVLQHGVPACALAVPQGHLWWRGRRRHDEIRPCRIEGMVHCGLAVVL